MKKLLVIGASGLLGTRIMERARGRYDVIGAYNPEADGKNLWRLEELDIGSKESVDELLKKTSPDIVLLTAAMTNVDACEKNPEMANRVNASGPSLVARACETAGARLVHVSTDYVFDGSKNRRYTEKDVPRPISVYGLSKLAGERTVLATLPGAAVARTAVLYGWNPIEGKDNFVTWTLRKLRSGERVTMFEDQRVSPTFADDLASALMAIAESEVSGVLHVSGPDCIDRVTCGRLIAKVFGMDQTLVVPIRPDSISLPARRPAFSCLDVTKVEELLNRRMMPFETGLRAMKEQEGKAR